MIELKSCEEGIVIEATLKIAKKNESKLENVEKIMRFAKDELNCACAIDGTDGTNVKLARTVQSGISQQDLNEEVTHMEDLEKRLQNFLSDLPEPQKNKKKDGNIEERLRQMRDELAKSGHVLIMFNEYKSDEVHTLGNVHPVAFIPELLAVNSYENDEPEEPTSEEG